MEMSAIIIEKMQDVVWAAQGFVDHGVHKDGTHGTILKKALADLRAQRRRQARTARFKEAQQC